MGGEHAKLFRAARLAEDIGERAMHAARRQRFRNRTGIQRPLGNEGRVLEDTAETVEEIGAVDHALAFDGWWFSIQ
jgi:hypothetical protein